MNFFLTAELRETQYMFSFNDGIHLYQMYLSPKRNLKKSWKDARIHELQEISPINASASFEKEFDFASGNGLRFRLNTYGNWVVTLDKLSDEFRLCYDFHDNHTEHYDETDGMFPEKILSMNTGCKLNETTLSGNCSFTNVDGIPLIDIMISGNIKELEWKKIELFLVCTLTYIEKEYIFPQLVELPKQTIISISSAAVGIMVVLTCFALTSSIILYYKRNTICRKMTWEDNPNYSDSTSANEEDGNSFLPNWLLERNEMIYDTTCIEKGQELGHGNFGTVFEGRIRLGNAVYIFYLYVAC